MLFKQKTTTTSAIMAAVLALALSGTSYAAGNEILKSNIPQIYGKSKDTFQGTDGKTIIQVQDAHGNVESQENIQAIIKSLADQGKIDAIMDEGGWNEYDVSSLEGFSQEDKQLLMDWYTKYGFTHGATRYKALDNSKMPVIGSEDQATYMDDFKAFREAGANKKESLAATEKIKGVMEAVKLKLFDEETRGFLQASEDFKKDQITLTSYANALKTQADKVGVNVASFNNFAKVVESITLEEKIDFAKIDRERLDMVDELETKVDKKVADEIVTQSLNYRLGKVAASEYYNFLLEKANSAKLDMSKYGNVTQYSSLVNLYASINDDALFAETDRLEGEIKAKLFKDQKQVDFDVHMKNLDVLNKLISLQMTRTDLAFWKENKDKISAAKTVAFLKDQAKVLGLGVELQDSLGQIDQKLASNEKFYEIALKRDDVMVEKTLAMMDEKGFKTVVLVAGGFHSEGIVKALKAKAISHMIVTPRITNPDAENFWMQNMMGEQTEGAKQLAKAGIQTNTFTISGEDAAGGGQKKAPTSGESQTLLASVKAAETAVTAEGQAKLDGRFRDLVAGAIPTTADTQLSPAEAGVRAAIENAFANAGFKQVDFKDVVGKEGAPSQGEVDRLPITFRLEEGLDAPSLRGQELAEGNKITLPRAWLSLTVEQAAFLANLLATSERAEEKDKKADETNFSVNWRTNALEVMLAVKALEAKDAGKREASFRLLQQIIINGKFDPEAANKAGFPKTENIAAAFSEVGRNPGKAIEQVDLILAHMENAIDAFRGEFAKTVLTKNPPVEGKVSAVFADASLISEPVNQVSINEKAFRGQSFGTALPTVFFTYDAQGKVDALRGKIALDNGMSKDNIVMLAASDLTQARINEYLTAGKHVLVVADEAAEIKTAFDRAYESEANVHYLAQELTKELSKSVFGGRVASYDIVRGINFARAVSQGEFAGRTDTSDLILSQITEYANLDQADSKYVAKRAEVQAQLQAFNNGTAQIHLEKIVTPVSTLLNLLNAYNSAAAWNA